MSNDEMAEALYRMEAAGLRAVQALRELTAVTDAITEAVEDED